MLSPFLPPTPEATALASAQAFELARQTKFMADLLMRLACTGAGALFAVWWFRLLYPSLRAGNFPRTYVTANSLEEAEVLSAAQGDAAEVEVSGLSGVFAKIGRSDNQPVVIPSKFFEK